MFYTFYRSEGHYEFLSRGLWDFSGWSWRSDFRELKRLDISYSQVQLEHIIILPQIQKNPESQLHITMKPVHLQIVDCYTTQKDCHLAFQPDGPFGRPYRTKERDQSESWIFIDQQSKKNILFLPHCTQRASALLLFLLFKYLESVQSILDEGLKKSLSLLLLKFQSEECLTDRVRNALPIEITTKAPGALISISAGLGKQHLIRLQIK